MESPNRQAPPWQSTAHCYNWAERDAIYKASAKVMLDESGEFPFVNLLGLMMLAGMRPEEILLMRWESPARQAEPWPWPDMKAWEIVIPEANGKRVVPIIPQLARLLSYWPCPKRGLLLPFRVTGKQIGDCWRETAQRAGVKPVGIHALQATYCAMMRDVFGLSNSQIAKIIGTPVRSSVHR